MIRVDKREPLARFILPRRRRPLRRQLQPDGVRLAYFVGLRALMAKAHAMVVAEVLPLVHELAPDHHADAAEDEKAARVRAALDAVAKRFARYVTPNALKPLVSAVASRTSSFQKAQLIAQLRDAVGVQPLIRDAHLAEMADAFTAENVALIKTVPERYFESLRETITAGVEAGSRASTIAAGMEQRYGVSESDAARIANDQVGKYFGELNRTRQTELGITGYTWTTVHDNRVRDVHGELDGTRQSWDEPPMGGGTDESEAGHPGSGINCRCQALPVLDGLLD